jgi:hypothetical protein
MRTYQKAPPWATPITKDSLSAVLGNIATVYVYTHHEIYMDGGELMQSRSGPNWEGGIVTLATCKHFMRTYRNFGAGVGVVGVTNKLEQENWLLYAGVVDKVFPSNYDLGQYLYRHHCEAYKAKLMTTNRLGDIVESFGDLAYAERYDKGNYIEPCANHCRAEELDPNGNPKWYKDIEYAVRGRVPQCCTLEPFLLNTSPGLVCLEPMGRATLRKTGSEVVDMFGDPL